MSFSPTRRADDVDVALAVILAASCRTSYERLATPGKRVASRID
jgi:hypothetical protein